MRYAAIVSFIRHFSLTARFCNESSDGRDLGYFVSSSPNVVMLLVLIQKTLLMRLSNTGSSTSGWTDLPSIGSKRQHVLEIPTPYIYRCYCRAVEYPEGTHTVAAPLWYLTSNLAIARGIILATIQNVAADMLKVPISLKRIPLWVLFFFRLFFCRSLRAHELALYSII